MIPKRESNLSTYVSILDLERMVKDNSQQPKDILVPVKFEKKVVPTKVDAKKLEKKVTICEDNSSKEKEDEDRILVVSNKLDELKKVGTVASRKRNSKQ